MGREFVNAGLQLALEQLSSLVEVVPVLAGSAAAVLRVMLEPPHPGFCKC